MAKTKDYGLSPGWTLIDQMDTLTRRRTYLGKWASLVNALPDLPDHLGNFAVAPARGDRNLGPRYGMLRAVPICATDGYGFYVHMPMRKPSKITSSKYLGRLVQKARNFDATHAAPVAKAARIAVDQSIASTAGLDVPVRLAGVGVERHWTGKGYSPVVDLITIGRDLRSGIERLIPSSLDTLEKELTEAVAEHARFEALRVEAASSGAAGWIDAAARRTLVASGLAPHDALDLLREFGAVDLRWTLAEGPPCAVALHMRDGTVIGTVGGPADNVRYKEMSLSVKEGIRLPETLKEGLVGRRLGALIEHPLIPPDVTIRNVSEYGNSLYVVVDKSVSLLVLE